VLCLVSLECIATFRDSYLANDIDTPRTPRNKACLIAVEVFKLCQ